MSQAAQVVTGTCDARFAAVEEAFAANLAADLEAGAACAVVVDGHVVVDVWGGVADVATARPWNARRSSTAARRRRV